MQTTSSPKVSVIVPVYNVEPYIANCLSSLMAQTMQELEFILVDDCGTDRSMDIAREYAARDPRFRILEGEQNLGEGPTRNRGMAAARGEYIGFVDSDDWVSPDYFQQLYDTAIAEQADVAKGRRIRIGESSSSEDMLNDKISECIQNSLWPGLVFTFCFSSAIYRTEVLLQHNLTFPKLRNGADTVFLTEYLLHANKVALNNNAIYFYLQHSSSVSHSINEAFFDSVFQNVEFRSKLINNSMLSDAERLEYWHQNLMGVILRYLLGYTTNASTEFYISFFDRAQKIFLTSGHAQALCKHYPSSIYSDFLEKTPEEIVNSRRDILPKLEYSAAAASQTNNGYSAYQAIAACSWRYSTYRLRYRYCQIMARLTIGQRRTHYKRKRDAYRQLLRDIRHVTKSVTFGRGLAW